MYDQAIKYRRGCACVYALLAAVLLSFGPTAVAAGAADESAAWAALSDGAIVLLRHADAPGIGDPAGFQLADCGTQRNLGEAGRAQARRIGESFRQRGVKVGAVLASQWCRTRDTAELAFAGRVQTNEVFNSFFQNSARAEQQTAAARAVLLGWSGPGVMVIVTHQVNISALTGLVPAAGEAIVMHRSGTRLQVVMRITP